MKHTFNINIIGDVKTTLQKVKVDIEKHGGSFSGEFPSGTFTGSGIDGFYHIEANIVMITITKKPLLIPLSIIENKVKEYFKQ